jgi:3-oxoacyl-[acyl-carrier protein] reductase
MVRFDFSGQIALVTGGSQGIGRAIAAAFRAAGAAVHVTGTRAAPEEYEDDLSGFTYHRLRLADAGDRARVCAALPVLDVLVNNAAQVGANEYAIEDFQAVIDTNLTGTAALTYLFADALAKRPGSIVNIASSASFLGLRDAPAYTASKAGLLGFTRALADKWAPKRIRCNAVAPGFVDTRMIGWVAAEEEKRTATLRTIPLRRFAEPAEIAPAVLFLASEAASYITGQSLIVDGGHMLR